MGNFLPKEAQICNIKHKKTAGRAMPRRFWFIVKRALLYPFARGVKDLAVR